MTKQVILQDQIRDTLGRMGCRVASVEMLEAYHPCAPPSRRSHRVASAKICYHARDCASVVPRLSQFVGIGAFIFCVRMPAVV